MSAPSVDASAAVANSGVAADSDLGIARAARGSALNLVGAAVSAISAFALVAVITRGISQVQAGVFFSITSLFIAATSLGQLGTNVGLVYFLARARTLGRLDLIRRYLRTAVIPVLAVGLAITLLVLVLAPELGRLTNPDHASLATNYLRDLAWFVAPACLATAVLAATRGMGTMRPYALVEQMGRQLVQLLLVAVVIATSANGLLTWAWAAPYIASFVAAVWWWRAIRNRSLRSWRGPVGTERIGWPFWKFTAPRTIGSVVLVLIQRIDIVLVGILAGAVPAALFTASTRFVVAGQGGAMAVALAVQPPLAAAIARGDHYASRHLFQTSAAWLMGVTWPLYLTFCINAHTLLGVFGHGYSDGAKILVIVTIGMMIGAGVGDVDSAQTMSGKTTWSLATAILGLAVMIGLDVWLIPIHGALGAAFGWAGAVAAKNLMGLALVWPAFGLHPFSRSLLVMSLLNLGCFAGIELLATLLPVPGAASLAIGLVVGTAVYVAGLWLLRRPLSLDEFFALRRRGNRAATQKVSPPSP